MRKILPNHEPTTQYDSIDCAKVPRTHFPRKRTGLSHFALENVKESKT